MQKELRSVTSIVRWGHNRTDITPPVGIYHRMWGAARTDVASGVHAPLFADVVTIRFLDAVGDDRVAVRAHLDFMGLTVDQDVDLRNELCCGVQEALAGSTAKERIDAVLSCSHTHASGFFTPDRVELPGGHLIPAYLEGMRSRLREAARMAEAGTVDAVITWAVGKCNMGANRDCMDDERGMYVCGLNMRGPPADDTVVVGRVVGLGTHNILAVIVNYACHATTLAFENSLISPDYVGALRDTVTKATGACCIFAQGASADIGPRRGFTGGTLVLIHSYVTSLLVLAPSVWQEAEKNGRWLGYAALSALESMGPPCTDYQYAGPVISGATLGVWNDVPMSPVRREEASYVRCCSRYVQLPLKPRPSVDELSSELESLLSQQRGADAAGNALEARDLGAKAERVRRLLGKIGVLPADCDAYPFPYSVLRLGDAFWVTCGGEPYSILQVQLRRRFPNRLIVVSTLAGAPGGYYLLPKDMYGVGLYQEEPTVLAASCLEVLIEAIAAAITAML